MREIIEKYCLNLAASDFTKRELREIATWIEKNGPEAFVKTITELRSIAHVLRMREEFSTKQRIPVRSRASEFNVRVVPGKKSKKADALNNVTSRVVHILKYDLQLSVKQSAELLGPIIEKHAGNDFQRYMPKPKETFKRWIQRVRRVIPDSLLLHEITTIRKAALNEDTQDWPLRER